MKYSVIIVAAGSGSRMGLGYNKMLFALENGNTILEETVSKFKDDENCEQIIVVTSKEDFDVFQDLLKDETIEYALGGQTRQQSVYNGLQKVMCDYVLIHDGARPWISKQNIDDIVDALEKHDACLLMVPVKDTIKIVKDGIVEKTLERAILYQAQTPQAFKTSLIMEVHSTAKDQNIEVTDDAMLVEELSDTLVYMVKGDYENKKVTTIDDIR